MSLMIPVCKGTTKWEWMCGQKTEKLEVGHVAGTEVS